MCFNDSIGWILEGILSYHGNCGQRLHPAVYSSITSNEIRAWIVNTIGNDYMFRYPRITEIQNVK